MRANFWIIAGYGIGGMGTLSILDHAFELMAHVLRLSCAALFLTFGEGPVFHKIKHLQRWADGNTQLPLHALFYERLQSLEGGDRPDVVVAHFREHLGWIKPYLPYMGTLHLYCKEASMCTYGLPEGEWRKDRLKITMLPNVGRESHSYLTHVVKHYAHLADRTVFTMASINANPVRWWSFNAAFRRNASLPIYKAPEGETEAICDFSIGNDGVAYSMGDGYDALKVSRTHADEVVRTGHQNVRSWLIAHTGLDLAHHDQRLCTDPKSHGAIFTATKAQLRQYPRKMYQKLLQENSRGDLIEAGYFMERLWRYLWCVPGHLQTSLHNTAIDRSIKTDVSMGNTTKKDCGGKER